MHPSIGLNRAGFLILITQTVDIAQLWGAHAACTHSQCYFSTWSIQRIVLLYSWIQSCSKWYCKTVFLSGGFMVGRLVPPFIWWSEWLQQQRVCCCCICVNSCNNSETVHARRNYGDTSRALVIVLLCIDPCSGYVHRLTDRTRLLHRIDTVHMQALHECAIEDITSERSDLFGDSIKVETELNLVPYSELFQHSCLN